MRLVPILCGDGPLCFFGPLENHTPNWSPADILLALKHIHGWSLYKSALDFVHYDLFPR